MDPPSSSNAEAEILNSTRSSLSSAHQDGLVGLRDADWGGAVVYPSDPVVDAALRQFLQAIRASGGEPEIGRSLGMLLREVGFSDVRMSASFEVYDPMIAARYLATLTGDHPIAPNLFLAQPWCEAVARKL